MRREQPTQTMPDMTLFMNLMIVLIPMLLATAQFSQISIIDIKNSILGTGGEGEFKDIKEKLKLSLLVSDSAVSIASAHSILPSIFYRVVEGGKYESAQLLALTEKREAIYGFYGKDDKLLLTRAGLPAQTANIGDTLFLEKSAKLAVVIHESDSYRKQPILLRDIISLELKEIYRNYPAVPDRGELTIGSEDSVLCDYLVQIMDAAELGGYSALSFAKIKS